jgi:hypothetical protein
MRRRGKKEEEGRKEGEFSDFFKGAIPWCMSSLISILQN